MSEITVTLIEETPTNGRGFATRQRYRIVGEPTSEAWKKSRREDHEPWCELTIYSDDDRLTSYGGELWPMAWPEWFTPIPGSPSAGSGGIHVTREGMKVLRAAANAVVGAPPKEIETIVEKALAGMTEIESLAIEVKRLLILASDDGDAGMIEAIRKDIAEWKGIIDEA